MDVVNATVCVFNAGAIRLDDQLMDTITEYDILRCLPFLTNITSLSVNGLTLVKTLNNGLTKRNTGMFISYAGIEYDIEEKKWFLQSNRQSLENENLILKIVSIPYFVQVTELVNSTEILVTNTTMTRAFIKYLEKNYSDTKHHGSS